MTEGPKFIFKIAAFLFIVLLFLSLIAILVRDNISPWRYSRDVKCGEQAELRGRDICKGIERNLEYTCCGHAIISPGYRSTWKTVVAVWCEQQIKREDMKVLHGLSESDDWRLAFAAESLLRLLTGRDPYRHPEVENSIFNPLNPSYLLRDGCKSEGK